jgi:hypothetical protein
MRSSSFQFTRFEFWAPQTLSTRIHFPCIFVFLYQNWKKNSFPTPLNHGKANDIKKAIISCPEPCISVFDPLKSLESSFGTNSRFGHGSKKICWPFVLGILDDCKCSENFLAPTITTPIRLSATFSIQIVDGLQVISGCYLTAWCYITCYITPAYNMLCNMLCNTPI